MCAGFKTTLGGGNQRANFAAFYYDCTDLQQAVVSPIAGTVVEKHINLGEVVSPQRSVYTIANLCRLWVLRTMTLLAAESAFALAAFLSMWMK